MDEAVEKAMDERAGKAKAAVGSFCRTTAKSILEFIKDNSIMDEEELLSKIADRIEATCMMSTMILVMS